MGITQAKIEDYKTEIPLRIEVITAREIEISSNISELETERMELILEKRKLNSKLEVINEL